MSGFAFAPPLTAASAFTPAALPARAASPLAPRRAAPASAPRRAVTMLNPFGNRNKDGTDSKPDSSFMAPQPGDPGYVAPPPVPKGTGMAKSEPRASEKKKAAEAKAAADAAAAADEAKAAGKADNSSLKPADKTVTPKTGFGAKLPVTGGDVKRGLDLLREDLFKNAPTTVGVGRQDVGAIMKPLPGEPGYKPAAYETVKVSDLGISPFPEDANAVGKVGGIEAVKKAAVEIKAGKKSGAQVKKEVLNIKTETEEEEKVYDIPDYLKPIPEDTPRKGYTWKNYIGR